MQLVTLFISILGFFLAFILRPMKGLGIYFIGLFWYSQNLTISIGKIEFTTSRIIIIGLLANIIFRAKLIHNFKWKLMDTLMVALIFAQIIASTISMNISFFKIVERQGGIIFDTILPYFAARCIINNKAQLLNFVKVITLIVIPLVIIGVYRSVSGIDLLGFMTPHFGWDLSELISAMPNRINTRYGFYRAYVTFTEPISYGLFLGGIAPLCIGLWNQKIWKKPIIIFLFVLILIGILSSMSSAAIYSILASASILLYFRFFKTVASRSYIILFVIGSILLAQAYIGQPFYEYLARKGSYKEDHALYRITLVKEAFSGGMKDHLIAGFGYVGGDSNVNDANELNKDFNWEHTDLVNVYIMNLVNYGLIGLIPFLAINVLYYYGLYQGLASVSNKDDYWLVCGFLSAMIGWNLANLTVGILEQMQNFYYIMIAICCNMSFILKLKYNYLSRCSNTQAV